MVPSRRSRRLHTAGTLRAVALPVLARDVRRILVPVPHARVATEVVRRVTRVERVADPLERERLGHERAVRAYEREALAPVPPIGPLVRRTDRVGTLVAPVPHEPLPRPARVHREGDLL